MDEFVDALRCLPESLTKIQLYFTLFRETKLQINNTVICHDLQNYREKARIYGNTSIK